MIEWTTLSTFILVVLGLFIIPGPAVFITIAQAAKGGRRTGILTGLGIATGDFLHVLFAAVGLSAILMTSSLAFTIVKLLGAAYLLYMGIRAFIAKEESNEVSHEKVETSRRAYRQGFIVEVLNPKTALFFLAFFPQFVNPANGSAVLQFLLLGVLFVVMSILFTSSLAIGTEPISRLLKRQGSGFSKWGGKVVGLVYIGIGLQFIFSSK